MTTCNYMRYCENPELGHSPFACHRLSEQPGVMTPVSGGKTGFDAALDYTLDEVRKVMVDRHKKYGPGNILRHGEFGVVVRLGDKYERLDNSRELDFADESVDDTVLDIIGYGLILKMLRAKAWPGQKSID